MPLSVQAGGAPAYLHVKYPASLPRKKEESIVRFHITPTATGSKVLVLHVEFKAPTMAAAAPEDGRPETKPAPGKAKARGKRDSGTGSPRKSAERKHALSRDLRIQALPRRTALGLDEESVEDVRGVAAVVGLPGLILLALTAIRDRRAAAPLPPPRTTAPTG